MANYLYNGVELPDINAVWDKETYPYAAMSYDDEYKVYAMWALSTYFYVKTDGYIWNGPADFCQYGFCTDRTIAESNGFPAGEWFVVQSGSDADGGTIGLASDYFWASHDILNADGSIYLAASDPVPVGGAIPEYAIIPTADYKAACDAIRAKTGKTDLIKSGEMAAEIASVPTGGGGGNDDVVLFEYDGQPTETYIDAQGDGSMMFYHVTDTVITETDIANITFYTSMGGDFDAMIASSLTFQDLGGAFAISVGDVILALVCPNVGYIESVGITVPKTGIYSVCSEGVFLTKAVILGKVSQLQKTLDDIISGSIMNYLESGVSKIRKHAFCNLLIISASFPNVVEVGYNAFNTCILMKSIDLPLVETIGNQAFYDCDALSEINFPKVKTIGDNVFNSCAFTNLVFPETLETMGTHAFWFCSKLKTVTFKGTPTSIGADAFNSCSNLTTINVPWAEGAVANAPWGATQATINYGVK